MNFVMTNVSHTVKCLIAVQCGIIVQGGKFIQINSSVGRNNRVGWKMENTRTSRTFYGAVREANYLNRAR